MNSIDKQLETIDKQIVHYTILVNDLWKKRDELLGVTKIEIKKTKRVCDLK